MSGPIFGSSSALGGSSGGNRHLVEFRAGRMNLVNKMVHPDNRKGLVYVYQAEDGLIHFCWKDRTTGNVEDDLIVFPDDCEFKKIENVKNGRVFLLKFKSSSRRLFFWMQEPKTDKDDEWCRRINEVINNPPSASSLGGGSGRGGSSSDNGDLQYIMQNMSQQQLMQLFGGVGQMGGLSSLLGSMSRTSSGNSSSRTSATTPSSRSTQSSSNASSGVTVTTPTAASNLPSTPRAPRKHASDSSKSSAPAAAPATAAATPINSGAAGEGSTGGNRVRLSDLQNYLAEMNPASSTSDASQKRNVDLSTAVNSDSLSSVISDKDQVESLIAHLPQIEGDKKQQLKETLSSPQFQQALSMFSNALQSGQLGPVVSQFQLNAEAVAAANSGDLEQFVKALENAQKKNESEKAKTASPSEEKTDTKEENGTSTGKADQKDDDPMTG
ncbi:proteasomal ubiquitin receptor ADRM1 homolog [Toxorhynchites rutilus septentrionalis]|uniref:proteasomal ubiquitin receptor ADRM1 homolog n=1 Tax=Toxorhynchites rutilus septentrionalis TaxID=329112 RepID=UPI00247AF8AF|nr:proteasomal ubiquitin receptor ADRM1 homolog [Toxorhynchites rutilus septentrionalis]